MPALLRFAVVGLLLAGGPDARAQDAEPDWSRPLEPIHALRQDQNEDWIPDRVGETVLVAGRVTAGTGVLRNDVSEVYIQDGTGGLRLLLSSTDAPVLRGDSVLVHGTLGFRAGMLQMTSPAVQVVPSTPREIQPKRLLNESMGAAGEGPNLESNEGELVEIMARVVRKDVNAHGQQLVLLAGTYPVSAYAYTSRNEAISFDNLGEGDHVRIRGIAVQFDLEAPYTGSYLVYPLSPSDVERIGIPPSYYRWGAAGVAALLLLALVWVRFLRRTVDRRTSALRVTEARYVHLFNGVADPVVVLDARNGGAVLEANVAAQKAFGVDAIGQNVHGERLRLTSFAPSSDDATDHLAEADRVGAASATIELLHTDGKAVPYEFATRRLALDSGTVLIAVARDIAERRRYELGLLDAMASAEAARAAAEEANRLKSAILANVSHEIRTPLTAVLGFADVLREEVPADLYEYADSIYTGGQRLLRTLNDVLDFARLDADAESFPTAPVDVVALIRRALAESVPEAKRKGLGLRFGTDVPSLEVVHAAGAIERIVEHLVGNALKFTDRGEVQVSLHNADDFFALRVRDTGVGIASAFMPDLYEPFKQESNGHDRAFEGTGLGLAIVKRLADRMGADVRVWSEKGEGTLFEVAFPLTAPDEATLAAERLADRALSGDGEDRPADRAPTDSAPAPASTPAPALETERV